MLVKLRFKAPNGSPLRHDLVMYLVSKLMSKAAKFCDCSVEVYTPEPKEK